MGKLMDRLTKQLTTEHKKDAEECIEIYNWIKSTDKDGRVWSSRWEALVDVVFKGYPSSDRRYYLNITGKTLLGKINAPVEEKMYSKEEVKEFISVLIEDSISWWTAKVEEKYGNFNSSEEFRDNWIKENLR